MKRERRNFDREFKLMAVNLCHAGKEPKEVADELGIRPELVRRSFSIRFGESIVFRR